MSKFVSVSQISYLPLTNRDILLNLVQWLLIILNNIVCDSKYLKEFQIKCVENFVSFKITEEGYSRSLYVSGKLPTYPSPKPTSTLTFHLG